MITMVSALFVSSQAAATMSKPHLQMTGAIPTELNGRYELADINNGNAIYRQIQEPKYQIMGTGAMAWVLEDNPSGNDKDLRDRLYFQAQAALQQNVTLTSRLNGSWVTQPVPPANHGDWALNAMSGLSYPDVDASNVQVTFHRYR